MDNITDPNAVNEFKELLTLGVMLAVIAWAFIGFSK